MLVNNLTDWPTLCRVSPHVDNMNNRPNDNDGNNNHAAGTAVKQPAPVLTETLNRSKSDGILFEHSESERNYKCGELVIWKEQNVRLFLLS